MTDSNPDSKNELKTDSTRSRIDLGDDLLAEPTGEMSARDGDVDATLREPRARPKQSISERFESARIFSNEGIHEEAKHLLHEILIEAPDHLPSRKLLEEIHEVELKQIFGDGTQQWRRSSNDATLMRELDPRRIDTDEIVGRLDRDLKLGLQSARPSLIAEKSQVDELVSSIEASLAKDGGESEQDRVDIAIGFLEMGVFEVATRLLRPLVHSDSIDRRVSAAALLALSLISSGQAFEATLVLQPLLQEPELARAQRAELLYLMGRASESMEKPGEALGWYLQANNDVPRYRDVTDRIQRLK